MSTSDVRDKVETVIIGMAKVRQITQMYGQGHRIAKEGLDESFDILDSILKGTDEVTIGIIGDEMAYEARPFYETSLRIAEFIDYLISIKVRKISFSKGLEREEFMKFADVLTLKLEDVEQQGGMQKMLADSSVTHIVTGEIGFVSPKTTEPEEVKEPDQAELDLTTKKNYGDGIEYIRKTYEDVKANNKLNTLAARQIVSGMITDIVKNKNLLMVLTSIKGSDEGMFAHCMNVAVFVLMQAEALGMERTHMADIGMAAMLHDVGRLSSHKEAIESGNDNMSEADVNAGVAQDIKGAKMLLETEGISILAAIVAYEHNIRYDRSGGGPGKIYGEELNLVSMMIAIACHYDRLRRKPFYGLEGGPEKVYDDMMKLSGKDFHPDLLNSFFSLVGVFPPGTLVELDTGEVALVVQSSLMDKKRPRVEVLYGPDGVRYKDPRVINLLEKDDKGRFKRDIVRSVTPMDKYKIPEKYS